MNLTTVKDNFLKFFFGFFLILFIAFPILSVMHVRSMIIVKYHRHVLPFIGIGYNFTMFAPKISETKYDIFFEIQKLNSNELINWKEVVPISSRRLFFEIFDMNQHRYHGKVIQNQQLKELLSFISKKYDSTNIKVFIKKYKYTENKVTGKEESTVAIYDQKQILSR